MAPNLIVQAIEDFGDGFLFERLCNDIMHLHYPNFKPGGHVHDLGIDGLLQFNDDSNIRLYFKESKVNSQKYIFQYSIQKTWESKIKGTLKKIEKNQIEADKLIYVTNLNPTTTALTKLQVYAQKNYGLSIEIHHQEFLRVYLEDPDNSHLVENYFASYLYQLKRWGI